MQKAIKHSDLKIILRIFRGVSVDLQIFVSPNRFFTSVGICWNDSSPMMSHQDVIHWYHIEMTSILTLPQENARSRSNNSPEIWISNSAKKLQPSHWTSPWRHPLSLAPNLLHPSLFWGIKVVWKLQDVGKPPCKQWRRIRRWKNWRHQ